jgi:hypothetical protein
MIPSKAIKVYKNTYTNQHEEFVTTVFTPYDAQQLRARLFKDNKIHRLTFKSIKDTTLISYTS